MSRPVGMTDAEWKARRQHERRNHYARHKETIKAKTRDYARQHADANRRRASAWAKNNKPRRRLRDAAWRASHAEQVRKRSAVWRESHRERDRQMKADWKKRNPEKAADSTQRYRSRIAGATILEPVDRLAVAERDGWRCHICGRVVSKKSFTLDHIVPVSQGGPHAARFLRLAHRSCNSRRGAGRIPAQMPLWGTLR